MSQTTTLHSEKIRTHKRTYFFDLKQKGENSPFLVITQSQKNIRDEYERQQILLSCNEVTHFGNSLMNCLLRFKARQEDEDSQSNYIERIREEYPNAYRPWSKEDDVALGIYLGEQMELAALSTLFQRQEGAIRARIRKLGLSKEATA